MPPILAPVDLPPVWLTLHIVAVWGLSKISPTVFGFAGDVAGLGLVALGALIAFGAAFQMVRHQTTVIPRRDPSALVSTGLYAWSRNPIYLADLIILLGVILWLDAVLALPLLGLFAWLIQTRFILDEEARLTVAFGPEFDLWAARTRRWLGRR